MVGRYGSYSNYGINSRHDNDTLRLQNVVQNIVISPRVMLKHGIVIMS